MDAHLPAVLLTPFLYFTIASSLKASVQNNVWETAGSINKELNYSRQAAQQHF